MEDVVQIDIAELQAQVQASADSIRKRAKTGTTSATGVMKELSGTVMPTLLKVVTLLGNHGETLDALADQLDELGMDDAQSQLLPDDAEVILDALTLCRALAEVEEVTSTVAAIDKAVALVRELTLREEEPEEPDGALLQPGASLPAPQPAPASPPPPQAPPPEPEPAPSPAPEQPAN